MTCPQHGIERFRIKVMRKLNMASDEIRLRLRTRPKAEIGRLYVGRHVTDEKAKEYVIDYLVQKGMIEKLISVRILA